MVAASHDEEKRGRRGEGTIFWHKEKKCHREDISLGFTASGKRRRKTVYGPTVADVQDSFKRLRGELANGIKSSAKYTVAEAVNGLFVIERGGRVATRDSAWA
jgi:hypothetical protein